MTARNLLRFGSFAVLAFAFGAMVPACKSTVSSLCSRACDCEHCNDYTRKLSCDELQGQEDVAHDYGCDGAFANWLACIDDNGTCNEAQARFTTRKPGHCASGACDGIPIGCSSDDDCPETGDDPCKGQQKALSDCQKGASAHKSVVVVTSGGPSTTGVAVTSSGTGSSGSGL